MACYSPLTGYKIYDDKEGRYKIKLAHQLHLEDMDPDNKVEVPCGKCLGCRLAKSSEWAMRCQLESTLYDDNYFLTLTYDDAHLPLREQVTCDADTGEVVKQLNNAVLVPDHITKFNKDLRRYYDYHYKHKGIRFFAAGEYGTQSMRPHYHMIMFNLPIYDLNLYKESFDGNHLYTSVTLNEIWNKGYVIIGKVTFESCAYVARYTTKKIGMSKQDYLDKGLEPEFVRMSRRPGIGAKYFELNADKIKKTDAVMLRRGDQVVNFKPSRYFDEHFYTEDELRMAKSRRIELASYAAVSEMSNTTETREEYLKTLEHNKQQRFRSIRRDI